MDKLSLEAFNAALKENKLYRDIDEELENFLLNFISYYESKKQSNKDSRATNHQWDTSISGDYRCCRCGTRALYGKTDLLCTKTSENIS